MRFVGDSMAGAYFCVNRIYRFTLWRRWAECDLAKMVAFIGLNPSTADEVILDNTVRRCVEFSKRWGYHGMVMLNLFGFRATDPQVMKGFSHPIGGQNDDAIREVCKRVGRVVVAWGNHGEFLDRGMAVSKMIEGICEPVYLKLNSSGHPAHPLYLKSEITPLPWNWYRA